MRRRECQNDGRMKQRHATTEVMGRESLQTTVLRGRRLLVARGAWIALTALTMGLFAVSIPAAYEAFRTTCEVGGCDFMQLSPDRVMALEELHLSVGLYAAYHVALAIFMALGYWTIGVTLFWKRSDNGLVLYASIALVTFGAMQPDTLRWLEAANSMWDLPVAIASFVGNASFFVLFCVFPDGRFVPRWTRWVAAAWIAYWLLNSFFPVSPFSPENWPLLIVASLFLGLLGSLVTAQIYRYRRVSGQIARQQTKWVVFGFTAAIVMFVGVALIGWIPELTRPGSPKLFYESLGALIITFCALLIPLSMGFAILHYRLWDIDLIINRSLVYVPLSAVLTTVFLITDTLLLPFLLRSILGVGNTSLTPIVSGVIIAVLFKPLRTRIEAGVSSFVDWLVGGHGTSETPQREEDVFIPPPSDK
jgi:hypothetical protein